MHEERQYQQLCMDVRVGDLRRAGRYHPVTIRARDISLAVRLRAFLEAYEREPWTPGGKVDCCLIIAEWAMWLGYPDAAAQLRGTYEPGQGQIDILAAHGGAVPIIESCALSIGAKPAGEPRCGDFGVVGSLKNITRQFGVIHDGDGWLTRAPDGFKRITARTLAAWRL